MVLGSAAAGSAATGNRVVHDAASGATIKITGEGNCATTRVEILGARKSGQTADSVGYSVDGNCNVTIDSAVQQAPDASPLIGGEQVSSAAVTARQRPATNMVELNTTTAAVTYGNYIHTSQTLQDIVNIDIAKYRYHTDRKWNGTSTWFGTDLKGVASTSITWNHPVSAVINYIGGAGSATYSTSTGAFHSDFLWCNLQAGQNFTMQNKNTSYNDGTKNGNFTQSRTCSGTHMATSTWADINPR
jgi:hypothetical protein